MNYPADIQNLLREGASLFRQGRLDEAQSRCLEILRKTPANPDANHLLGVLYHRSGRNEEAIRYIRKAIRKRPANCDYLGSLGSVLGASGRPDEAIRYFRKSLRIAPEQPETHYNMGCALQQKGLYDKAIASFRKALAVYPEYADALNNMGSTLMLLDRTEEALQCFYKVLELAPKSPLTHFNTALALGKLQRHEKAVHSYRRAIAIRPDYAQAHNNMGNALREQGRPHEALKSYDRAIAIEPQLADAHCNRGGVLNELGQTDAALDAFGRAVELDAGSADSHFGMADIYLQQGHKDEARSYFRKAIAIRPDYAEAHRRLALSRTHRAETQETAAMEKLLADPDCGDEAKMHLAFGLGKVFEDLGRYGPAFEMLRLGNALKRRTYSYDVADEEALMSRIRRVFSGSFLARSGAAGIDDDSPIFILGMPRSGTSLVEQVLASHPDVHGAGELDYMAKARAETLGGDKKPFPEGFLDAGPDDFRKLAVKYLERLRKHSHRAKHITDKMPHNFLNIGIIRAALPNARIIHCNRFPMDTCLSIFRLLFTGEHPYAYDLRELGRYYRSYLRVMDHWRSVFPESIIEIQYEELVGDPEQEIRRLLDACGLPFDDACLNFHKSDRIVKTLSVNQVRKPMYGSSVNAWKRFEGELEPLSRELNGEP